MCPALQYVNPGQNERGKLVRRRMPVKLMIQGGDGLRNPVAGIGGQVLMDDVTAKDDCRLAIRRAAEIPFPLISAIKMSRRRSP